MGCTFSGIDLRYLVCPPVHANRPITTDLYSAHESGPGRSMEKAIRIVAAVISRPDGFTLVVRKRGTAAFMQAGGKIEPGERPEEALARELFEELGMVVSLDQLDFMGQFDAPAANEPGHHVVADVFRVEFDGEDLVAAAEIEEFRWISPREPGDLVLAPLSADRIFPALITDI
jgi:8-oxo-dGTP diphosphatase